MKPLPKGENLVECLQAVGAQRNLNVSCQMLSFLSFPFPPPFPKCLCIAPNTFRLLSAKNNTVKLNDRSCEFVRKFETKHQCKLSVLSELNVLSRTHSRLVLGKVCRQNLTASSEPCMEKGPCQAELACADCSS